ncbi:hypothetical protein IAE37_001194 [Pseudomonas sp. S31]|uniref:hypothetical protein n=1 Tax=Pseudomonas sp. S31 TaxID=1564473 RepID=UPI0019125A3E|nr:hypothetical protein [Pseudomonas sp. S31]MBK4998918.1 hypothetical protein [Pseudomonas sp. S31]
MNSFECQIFPGDAFRNLRSSSLLQGKKLLGSGSFSLVFEGSEADTVFHLSIDNAGHDFSVKAKQHSIDGVAKIHRDFGAVALYQDDAFYPDYLWLAELELLHPLSTSPAAFREVQDLLRILTGVTEGVIYSTFSEKCKLLARLNHVPIYPRTMRCTQALRKLLFKYVTTTSCDVDVRISNFMIRPYTGEVVLNGPVNWLCDISPERQAQLAHSEIILDGTLAPQESAQILPFQRVGQA